MAKLESYLEQLSQDQILPPFKPQNVYQEDITPYSQSFGAPQQSKHVQELNTKVLKEISNIINEVKIQSTSTSSSSSLSNSTSNSGPSSDQEVRMKSLDADISTFTTDTQIAAQFLKKFSHIKSLLKEDSLADLITQLASSSNLNKTVRFIVETGLSTSIKLEQRCAKLLKHMSNFESKELYSKKTNLSYIYVWTTGSDIHQFNIMNDLTEKIQTIGAMLKNSNISRTNRKTLLSKRKIFQMVRMYFTKL